MEVQTLQIFAGSISAMLFITGNIPMLLKAYRTKDLRSYSLSHLILVNTGNCPVLVLPQQSPGGSHLAAAQFLHPDDGPAAGRVPAVPETKHGLQARRFRRVGC